MQTELTSEAKGRMCRNSLNLTPAELKAIEGHRRNMESQMGENVAFEAAVKDFVANHRAAWLRQEQKRANEEQVREIERHKWYSGHKDVLPAIKVKGLPLSFSFFKVIIGQIFQFAEQFLVSSPF